ncbi:hypothetical protein CDCA_CDCA16G4282 [Cyanidium caldarium]|uniref:DNA primase large subunit C-terminal domain-containing protein n=1 Tax=Cyanidium caldarium TaxID=2771 RepID=A0AAV9J0Z0_CYACA|nr:hypothetical protein CDCA_CDCA16G4282 [Cyanidium caldarium]
MEVVSIRPSATRRESLHREGETSTENAFGGPTEAIDLYLACPDGECELEAWVAAAAGRLDTLVALDAVREQYWGTEDLLHRMQEVLEWGADGKARPYENGGLVGITADARRLDAWGHYALRLALGAESESRRWLARNEAQLFRARVRGAARGDALAALLRSLLSTTAAAATTHRDTVERVPLEQVPPGLYRTLRSDGYALIRAALHDQGEVGTGNLESGIIPAYRLPFERALRFLAPSRTAYLQDGYAYLPEPALCALLEEAMERHVATATERLHRQLSGDDLAADAQLAPLVTYLQQQLADAFRQRQRRENIVGSGSRGRRHPGAAGDPLHLDQLDEALPCMPLCMQQLLRQLRQTGHLRHGARLQLGLFLKGAGFTLEESLEFWRRALQVNSNGMRIAPGAFEREYAYGIRYNYGLEGKRKDFPPFSCAKILEMRPGHGEVHGCPYRELSADALRQELLANGGALTAAAAAADVEDIVQTATAAGQPQHACGKCFQAITRTAGPESTSVASATDADAATRTFVTQHPNDYLLQARAALLPSPPSDASP